MGRKSNNWNGLSSLFFHSATLFSVVTHFFRLFGIVIVSVGMAKAETNTAQAVVSAGAVRTLCLKADHVWHLNAPDGIRMDSSGLVRLPDGNLLIVNDRDGAVYSLRPELNRHRVDLSLATNLFSPAALAPLANRKHGHYDGEGLAIDSRGRIYLCEETDRWILRCDPKTGAVELLEIDWSSVSHWFSTDKNASFEGIAIDGNRMWVANERRIGRIILVDLESLKVLEDFQAAPVGNSDEDVHYSDLCFFDGFLWVLCRENFLVLKVNPKTHETVGQYSYRSVERSTPNVYAQPFNVGFMEGLAVDATSIWLVADNNGFPRVSALNDRRSTLWRCPRLDLVPGGAETKESKEGAPETGRALESH